MKGLSIMFQKQPVSKIELINFVDERLFKEFFDLNFPDTIRYCEPEIIHKNHKRFTDYTLYIFDYFDTADYNIRLSGENLDPNDHVDCYMYSNIYNV